MGDRMDGKVRWLLGSVMLAGCQGCPPSDPKPPEDTPDRQDPVVDGAPDDRYSADAGRFVLALGGPTDDGCPDQSSRGWTGQFVFADMFDEDDDDDPLARLCLYTKDGAGSAETAFEGLSGVTYEPAEIRRDAGGDELPEGTMGVNDHVVIGLEDIDEAAVSLQQHDRYVIATGLAKRDTPPTSAPPSTQITRLAILDSAPDSVEPWPRSAALFAAPDSHGLWIAALAQELVCLEQTSCPAQITTRQVMRQASTSFGRAKPGSAWGTITDLARAISLEVTDWKADRAKQEVGNLVINLSLAWHPRFGGGMDGAWEVAGEGETVNFLRGVEAPFEWAKMSPNTFPPDVRAVLYAMARARCEGAIIVAAAGNRTNGPAGQEGPMMPAAWQGLDASIVANCASLNLARSDPGPSVPLLYAAGGVEEDGRDLAASRVASRPFLLAYADHATHYASSSPTGREGPAMTGTSVAAITVASTAAVRWGWQPDQTGAGIMGALYAAAKDTADVDGWLDRGPVEAFPGRDATKARWIRPCEALADIDQGYTCKLDGPLPELGNFGEAALTDDVVGTWPGAVYTHPACGAREIYRHPTDAAATSQYPCPSLQLFSPAVSPWVLPQPPTEGCEDCFLDFATGRLYIKLDVLPLVESLSVLLKTSTREIEFNIPPTAVPAGAKTMIVKFDPAVAPTAVESASLTGVRMGKSLTWHLMVLGATP